MYKKIINHKMKKRFFFGKYALVFLSANVALNIFRLLLLRELRLSGVLKPFPDLVIKEELFLFKTGKYSVLGNEYPVLALFEQSRPLNFSKKNSEKIGLVDTVYFNTTVPAELIKSVRFYRYLDSLQYFNCGDCEVGIVKMAGKLRASYVQIRDAYVNFAGSVVTSDGTFLMFEKDTNIFSIRQRIPGRVTALVDNIIALGHNSLIIFSHWFYDFLAPLTMFPEELVKKSYYVINRDRALCEETLAIFGVKKDHIISVAFDEWIKATNVYTAVNPTTHDSHFGTCMLNLSRLLHKYYRLDLIESKEHLLSNRKKGLRRHITNFDEVVSAIRAKYSNINFTVVDDIQSSLYETAVTWASAKLMFMPTGSNFIKNLFMHPNSIIVVGLANSRDNCIAMSAVSHGVYTLFFTIIGMDHHYDYNGHPCDLKIATRCIGIALDCLKYGDWKEGETFNDYLREDVVEL
jgi:hypothetical protein